jgi:uncharacterized protein YkuJ
MTDDERRERITAWLATRPECVQRLAAEFPPDAVFEVNGVPMYVVSYTEDDDLMVSAINPRDEPAAAFESRQMLCAHHIRDGSIRRLA